MTCIIGIQHNGKGWIGADRGYTITGSLEHVTKSNMSKIVSINDGIKIGCSGASRVSSILSAKSQDDKIKDYKKYSDELLYYDLPEFLYRCLHDKLDGDNFGGIVSVFGRVGIISTNYGVIQAPEHGVYAYGSGGEIAMGALYQFAHRIIEKETRYQDGFVEISISDALSAASFWDVYTMPPFDIEFTEVE